MDLMGDTATAIGDDGCCSGDKRSAMMEAATWRFGWGRWWRDRLWVMEDDGAVVMVGTVVMVVMEREMRSAMGVMGVVVTDLMGVESAMAMMKMRWRWRCGGDGIGGGEGAVVTATVMKASVVVLRFGGDMGTQNSLWNLAKKSFTFGLISLTIADRYASIVPVQGFSMSPTFNPHTSTSMGSLTDDRVLVEKLCLEKYKFSHGDVIVFCSPSDHREKNIKRIAALSGDWIKTHSHGMLRIPEGHCWVEGDNSASSLDSRSFGPIPLGLVRGRVTHIVWPPQRVGKVERRIIQDGLSF
ncbi:hypothetical protein F0562_017684 [Nyssa sinensis]|uniref:Mitochondrial inner membrane protease subunit 2 n=1 Tax=Nyssa sinensis TaxID=561372 RepID=A0A5J4ZJJ9_9ASTE|nr:hypothetical protein F0562_017684 [Nyssa sinensis]